MATCKAAVDTLVARIGPVVALSSWYESAPVPPSDQPRFVNGVVRLKTELAPRIILETLHDIERAAGRTRRQRWEARVLDLDLLAVGDLVLEAPDGPVLPHPRIAERSFVLRPLAEVGADWRHPITGHTPAEMLDALTEPSETTILHEISGKNAIRRG